MADPKFINLRVSKLASDFRTFDPGINKNLDKINKAYYSNVSRNCFKNRKRYREKGSDKEAKILYPAKRGNFVAVRDPRQTILKVALEPED